METKRCFKSVICFLLLVALALSASGCTRAKAEDLMAGFKASAAGASDEELAAGSAAAADFTVRLFQKCAEEDGNVFVSPVTVMGVLTMIGNGAEGSTLAQLEEVLGEDIDILNSYFRGFMDSIGQGSEASIADSLWLNSAMELDIRDEFLQLNADGLGADVFSADLGNGGVEEVNRWAKKSTRGMIPKALDSINPGTAMIAACALAFDAKWEERYTKDDVIKDLYFTTESGEKRTGVDYMCSDKEYYIETENSIGFMKPYKGARYAFAALLPNEGTSLDELIASLEGEALTEMLRSPGEGETEVRIPKFESEYGAELNSIMKEMGLTDIFDEADADLSGIGTANGNTLYLDKLLQKAYVSVDENGTKAAAITFGNMMPQNAELNTRQVFLDSPFVYMIVDCESGTPLFIGAMRDIEG